MADLSKLSKLGMGGECWFSWRKVEADDKFRHCLHGASMSLKLSRQILTRYHRDSGKVSRAYEET